MKYKTSDEKEKTVDRKICTLSDQMVSLFVRQLQHELYNHNLYRQFANWFGLHGLVVLEQYYKLLANEEKIHHDWIADYLNECDAEYEYPEIPKVTEDAKDFITPFELTVAKEIETTNLIYDIVNLAQEEKDWMTFGWLMNSNPDKPMLVLEQQEEETISRTALDIATTDGSWLRKEKSIMNAYKNDLD